MHLLLLVVATQPFAHPHPFVFALFSSQMLTPLQLAYSLTGAAATECERALLKAAADARDKKDAKTKQQKEAAKAAKAEKKGCACSCSELLLAIAMVIFFFVSIPWLCYRRHQEHKVSFLDNPMPTPTPHQTTSCVRSAGSRRRARLRLVTAASASRSRGAQEADAPAKAALTAQAWCRKALRR
jgi:hypothetical protein